MTDAVIRSQSGRIIQDTLDSGTPTTVAYCYDAADRLTGTTVTDAPEGAAPVAAGSLTTTRPARRSATTPSSFALNLASAGERTGECSECSGSGLGSVSRSRG